MLPLMNKPTALLAALVALLTAACGPSLSTMHRSAETGAVQSDAPLRAHHEIVIAAPATQVWARLSDVSSWPSWHPTVRSAHTPASFTPGASFTWNNDGSEITSTLAVVRAPEVLAWTGSVATAKAIHVWRLSEIAPGQTRVEVDETMDGFLLTWFYGQKDLDQAVALWLRDLKTASETSAR